MGQSSPFTFMCSRIRSQVIRYFPWLTPWNRLEHFFFPAETKGIVCDGGEAAAHLPKGRGRSWLQRHSLCTAVLPLCRGCVDLWSDVLTWRAASIWSGAWLAGCHAYRNHICIPARPASTGRNSRGAGTSMKDHGNPILVWSGRLSFARGVSPCLTNPPPAICLQHLEVFCSLQVYDER